MTPRAPRPTLFPYTTLFRSSAALRCDTTPDSRCAATRASSAAGSAKRPRATRTIAPARTAPSSSLREPRSEEHTSELQSHVNLVCRLLLEEKKRDKRVGQIQ